MPAGRAKCDGCAHSREAMCRIDSSFPRPKRARWVCAVTSWPDGLSARVSVWLIPNRSWPKLVSISDSVHMGIVLNSPDSVAALRRAGQAAALTLASVENILKPGTSTGQINDWVREDTLGRGGRPSQLGYKGFPACVCTSRNQVVCHGIPSPEEYLQDGDIINVDVTTELSGYHGDTSRTFLVGTPSPEARHVVSVAEQCLQVGIREVRDGIRLGDLGAAMEAFAHHEGCAVVREFGGHGIGRHMHMEPHVPHHGRPGRGLRLKAGMAFTIEPMVNLGSADIEILDDGWTVVTRDGKWSAQFEHTVLVTRTGCEVLTRRPEP